MSDYQDKANKIVQDLMLANDHFSNWMGIQIIELSPGFCTLKATVKQDMVNGFGICHGGITYSIADSALAFASNSHGIKSVSVETSISHIKSANLGDEITAIAREKSLNTKLGFYEVELFNQHKTLIATFKGTVYRTSKEWEL